MLLNYIRNYSPKVAKPAEKSDKPLSVQQKVRQVIWIYVYHVYIYIYIYVYTHIVYREREKVNDVAKKQHNTMKL